MDPFYLPAFSFVIADDDADDQFLIQQAIKEVNMEHNCLSVTNGQQLLDLLIPATPRENAFRPDLILLDLNMPRLDGFATLSILQSNGGLKDIPIYVMSTSRAQRDAEQSYNLGAKGFFSKPAKFCELKDIIRSICHLQSELKKGISRMVPDLHILK